MRRSPTLVSRVTYVAVAVVMLAASRSGLAQTPPPAPRPKLPTDGPGMQTPVSKPVPTPVAAPLGAFVQQKIIVVPVQLIRVDPNMLVEVAKWEAFRKELDDSIGSAISRRGVASRWSYAGDVVRMAKRNAPYTGDPYALGALPLRGATYQAGDKIPDALGSNLRALIALGDTRFALVPVELRFEKSGARQKAVLKLALVDGRDGTFHWVGEASSDWMETYSAALPASLAAHVADLVIAAK